MHLFSLYWLLLREISLANGILIKSSHLWSFPILVAWGNDAVFMDDNARPHRARIVDTCLRQHHVTRMDWTACSPDLNPIEYVWDQLGRAVRQRLNINSTLVDLRRYMLEEWDRLPMAKLQRLIHSMRRRCDACIAAAGGATRSWIVSVLNKND